LSFEVADLEQDAGWAAAAAGCEYVLHVASPFPWGTPKRAEELVVPARDGTLRVLRAARDAGVRRVVLTSSFAAIGYGQTPRARAFDESDWTDPDRAASFYVKSKTVAERAAWDFIAREGGGLELSVVNPVAVFGPALGPDLSSSVRLIKAMLSGGMPLLPRLWFGIVDVRDVADLHRRALLEPAARGERFLAVAGESLSLKDIARNLKTQLGAAAARVSTREAPDWLLRLTALAVPAVRQILPELGKIKQASAAKARRLLGWQPRSNEEAILATAESLHRLASQTR
jgi:dihydroflavonol-4-reductase